VIGFVFFEVEAAIHFHNPLSKLKLSAFRTSSKLGLFFQIGCPGGCELRSSGVNMGPGLAYPG
jgi:hypothetical protein